MAKIRHAVINARVGWTIVKILRTVLIFDLEWIIVSTRHVLNNYRPWMNFSEDTRPLYSVSGASVFCLACQTWMMAPSKKCRYYYYYYYYYDMQLLLLLDLGWTLVRIRHAAIIITKRWMNCFMDATCTELILV